MLIQLKAQIVRITYSTTIVPKNFYHLTEDDRYIFYIFSKHIIAKEIELITEEFKPPRLEELTTI